MKLDTIEAKTLVFKTYEELEELPTVFQLQFVDNTIITTRQRTIWSWILWGVHRAFGETPLLSTHHIHDRVLSPNTHIEILNNIKASAIQAYNLDRVNGNATEINIVIHKCFNEMYNILTTKLEAYIAGADITDVLEVLKHPTIAEANKKLFEIKNISAKQINKQSDIIEKVLRDEPAFIDNSVAIALRHNLVRSKQLLQCVTARGYMSEVNNRNFKEPMLQSYSTGMRTLNDYACDSRMASIAAFAQASTMRQFQYVNRSLQLLNGDIKNLHFEDCGTTSYTVVTVDSMNKLAMFIGIYIMNDDNEWEVINHKDPKLLNKPLRLRLIVDCKHPDRNGVCHKCFGELSTGTVDGDKLGQPIAAHVQESESQGALSTKHFAANSLDVVRKLDNVTLNYLRIDQDDITRVVFTEDFLNHKPKILFAGSEVEFVNNITELEELEEITASRYSTISTGRVMYVKDGEEYEDIVNIGQGAQDAHLSVDAIRYLAKYGYSIDEQGNWVIDLSEWDIDDCFIKVPRKKVDMVASGKQFETFLSGTDARRSRNKTTRRRKTLQADTITNYDDFGEALEALQEITIGHAQVKISHMQVMMYALLAANPDEGDYRLPDPSDRKNSQFVSARSKFKYGNIAVALAYERQGALLLSPSTYIYNYRPDSEFEWFVLPGEELEEAENDARNKEVFT